MATPTQSSAADNPSAATQHHRLSVQLMRFVLTGGLSAVVDFGLLMLLSVGLGWDHRLAKALSFMAGTTTAYMINRRWTFRAAPSTRRFIAIVVLYVITFVLQVGLYTLLFDVLGSMLSSLVVINTVAFVIAQGVATTVNFIVQRTIIFRIRDESSVSERR